MATCATKTDTTRWNLAKQTKYNMVEGKPTLFKKYNEEWILAKRVCTRRGEMLGKNETKIASTYFSMWYLIH